MKLYVVADMEGIAGVVSFSQIADGDSQEIMVARQQFTREVVAVCEGALAGGVDSIYVNDFHGSGRNLILEQLPKEAMLIRGDFRMSAGYDLLDSSFAGIVFLGAHVRSGSAVGVLGHTYCDRLQFELFGQPVGEFDLLAFLAGERKVPTLLISGDSETVRQAAVNHPSTMSVVTKYPIGTQGALCLHPLQVCDILRDETKRSLKKLSVVEIPEMSPPLHLTVRASTMLIAERISWIPGLKKTDSLVFEFCGDSMRQLLELIYGLTLLAG